MRKIFKGLAAALVLVVVLTVLGVGVDGWRLYRNAVEQTGIEQAVEQVRAQEGYTPLN